MYRLHTKENKAVVLFTNLNEDKEVFVDAEFLGKYGKNLIVSGNIITKQATNNPTPILIKHHRNSGTMVYSITDNGHIKLDIHNTHDIHDILLDHIDNISDLIKQFKDHSEEDERLFLFLNSNDKFVLKKPDQLYCNEGRSLYPAYVQDISYDDYHLRLLEQMLLVLKNLLIVLDCVVREWGTSYCKRTSKYVLTSYYSILRLLASAAFDIKIIRSVLPKSKVWNIPNYYLAEVQKLLNN